MLGFKNPAGVEFTFSRERMTSELQLETLEVSKLRREHPDDLLQVSSKA